MNPAFHPWRRLFQGTRAGAVAFFPASQLPHIRWDGIEVLIQQLAWACESISQSSFSTSKWASIRINDSKEMAEETINLDAPAFIQWARKKHVIILNGYLFLADKSMQLHADKLKSYFLQLEGNTPKALQPVQQLRADNDIVIGVVIRHGGYDQWLNGKYYFTTESYIHWIREAVHAFKDQRIGFFLCSDREQDLSHLKGMSYRFRAGHDLENRAALATCDMLMSPPSSYSGWAACASKIPILILSSKAQTIRRDDFKMISNHTELKDESYPPNVDRTDFHTSS
jgi:hypothetical protein